MTEPVQQVREINGVSGADAVRHENLGRHDLKRCRIDLID